MLAPTIVRCGPSGWSSSLWNSLANDRPQSRSKHPLELLSRCFDTVEVNTTFREMPRPEITRLWLRKVAANPQFQFTALLNRQFSYERELHPDAVDQFKAGLLPLVKAGKMGALVMQFPWSFKFTAENRRFFIELRRTFHEFPLVAELRHDSWAYDEAQGTLMDYRVGFANVDQAPVFRAMPPTTFLTTSLGFVRMHGRDTSRWSQQFASEEEAYRYDYCYRPSELEEWRPRIEKLKRFSSNVFVTFNNDQSRKAILNAIQMEEMLGVERTEAAKARGRMLPPPLLAGAA